MGIVGWIVLGLLAGLIAKALMPGAESVGLIVATFLGTANLIEGRIADVTLHYQPATVPEPPAGTRPWLRRSAR